MIDLVAYKFLRWLSLAVLVIAIGMAIGAMWGCAIPVTVRPSETADGQKIPLATRDVAGDPAWADPAAAPAPGFDWSGLLLAGASLVGGTGAAAWALRAVGIARKAKVALGLTAQLADRLADAPDADAVAAAKRDAATAQQAAGVRQMIQEARGKA